MQHVCDLKELSGIGPSAVALGVFDGVHLGHQALIKDMVTQASHTGLQTAVMTFFPHPKVVLKGLTGRLYLTPIADRAELLFGLGVDYVVTNLFDESTRQQSAAEYVDLMQSHLGMVEIWSGDFGFGYKRQGTADYLRSLERDIPFSVHEYSDKVFLNGERVSSSRIRQSLANGDIDEVNRCLGRKYALSGKVIQGDQRGRTIGFPTANIDAWEQQVLPGNGVYATIVTLPDGSPHMAATNIGVRPTVDGVSHRIEAHLLDFNEDLYGKELRLEFVAHIRNEQKFGGLDELKAQIDRDVSSVREILSLNQVFR